REVGSAGSSASKPAQTKNVAGPCIHSAWLATLHRHVPKANRRVAGQADAGANRRHRKKNKTAEAATHTAALIFPIWSIVNELGGSAETTAQGRTSGTATRALPTGRSDTHRPSRSATTCVPRRGINSGYGVRSSEACRTSDQAT